MNPKRKEVQDYCLSVIGMITNNSKENLDLYKSLFDSMSDSEFDKFMCDLRDGNINLSIIVPAGNQVKITIENNFKVADKIGHKFFQKLVYGESEDLPAYTSNVPYLVVDLPIRRASQLLVKKISVPDHAKQRDVMTGQVVGDSLARRITYPELQVLFGCGLNKCIEELVQARGGDLGKANAMSLMLSRTGKADLNTINNYGTGVRSSETLKAILQAMHLRTSALGENNKSPFQR